MNLRIIPFERTRTVNIKRIILCLYVCKVLEETVSFCAGEENVYEKKTLFVYMKKNTYLFLSFCPLKPGGGGLKALTDMTAKNVSCYFGRLP